MKILKCKVCERKSNDLRFNVCFDCADCEELIFEGNENKNRKIEKEKDFEKYSTSISKLRIILRTYNIIK